MAALILFLASDEVVLLLEPTTLMVVAGLNQDSRFVVHKIVLA